MVRSNASRAVLSAVGTAALLGAASWAQVPNSKVDADQSAYFESKIRPVLVANCLGCHGEKVQKGGLRLDSRDALIKGGGRGAAVVAGDSEKSLLLETVRYAAAVKMPPA